MVLADVGPTRGRRASRRRSTPGCSATSPASSAASAPLLDDARRDERRRRRARQRDAASGWRGKDRATTSTPTHGGAINGPSSPRQPGSALKPFTYALAFEAGLHAGDACCPTCRRTSRPPKPGVLYSPRNYDGRYRGPLLARPRAGRLRERAGGGARVASSACRRCCASCARAGFTTFDADAVVLRARPDARQRRGPARRAGRRLRGVRARRRVACADVAARTACRATRERRAARLAADRVLDHRHPRPTPRRASTSSAAAATSSSRSRSR